MTASSSSIQLERCFDALKRIWNVQFKGKSILSTPQHLDWLLSSSPWSVLRAFAERSDEVAEGRPQALRTCFYPGDNSVSSLHPVEVRGRPRSITRPLPLPEATNLANSLSFGVRPIAPARWTSAASAGALLTTTFLAR